MEFKESSSKQKKSLLNTLLSKRSTRVEPHPYDKNNGNSNLNDSHQSSSSTSFQHQNPFQSSISANSTPIKRLYKIGKLNKLWHCHGSNQSITSNHSAPSNFLRKIDKNSKYKIRNTIDRHSHPIGSTNTQSDTNNYNVFYVENNNLNAINDNSKYVTIENDLSTNRCNGDINTVHRSISTEQFRIDSIPKSSLCASKSQEQIIVNDIDENVVCDSTKQHSPTSKSHDGNFLSNRNELDYPFGHSIAMSACRSRLREKLLPPGYKLLQSNEFNLQNSTDYPNVVAINKNSRSANSEQQKNSRSISCDKLPNAKRTGRTDSLAKHSLMAAQLINLIPTEVARERYIQISFIISRIYQLRFVYAFA